MHGVVARAGRDVARRKPPDSLQAYDDYLLGIEYKHRFTQKDNQTAKQLLMQAVEVDPGFARAYVGLTMAHSVDIDNGWATSGQLGRDVELNLFLDSHRKAGLPVCTTEAQLDKYPDMKRLDWCEQQRAKS